MVEKKYEKYIVYKTAESPLHPRGTFPGVPMMNLKDTAIKGAFYFECAWFTGIVSEKEAHKPHRHDFDEIIGIFGSNAEDFQNLYGDVEFWFDDEMYRITRSCAIYVPRGIWHTPIFIREIFTPILFMSTAPVHDYTQHINRDPKWKHLKDPPGIEKIQA